MGVVINIHINMGVVIPLPLQMKKDTMIGSLVRLPDNYLHLGECERVLRSEEHFKELIDLYQSKGRHRKG